MAGALVRRGERGLNPMERVAFVIDRKPGADPAEYKRRHDALWPEMAAALRGAGIHNYSIFLHGEILFAYLECEDFARMVRALVHDPVDARWQEHMRDMISVTGDPETGFARRLPELFHLD